MHSLSFLGLRGVLDAVGYLQLQVCKPSAFSSRSLPIGPRRAFKHAPTQDLCDEQHFLLFVAGVFSAPRLNLFQKGFPCMAHFSACCKQAHVCVTYLVTTMGGLPNVGGPTAMKFFFSSILICLFSFVLFLPRFLLLCAFWCM